MNIKEAAQKYYVDTVKASINNPNNTAENPYCAAFEAGAKLAATINSLQPIPLQEEQPEEGDRVFFWIKDCKGVLIGDYEGKRQNKNTGRFYNKFSDDDRTYHGTHWCPIPDALKNFIP